VSYVNRRSSPLKTPVLAALTSLALGGCMGSFSGADVTDTTKLAEAGSGVLLVHTSLHDEGCSEVTASLAKPVMSGRSIDIGRPMTLKSRSDTTRTPGRAVLPAGEYGIVRFTCETSAGTHTYAARVVERGSEIDGSGTVYEAPLVTFAIGPGEVVDAGSVRLAATPDNQVSVAVAPMPEAALQDLATRYASFTGARVVRPMAVARRNAAPAARL